MTAGRGSPVLRPVLVTGAGAPAGGGFVGASAARAGASACACAACAGSACVGSGWAGGVVRWARAVWTAGSGEVRSQSTRSG